MGEGLLRSRNDSDSCITKAHPNMGDRSQTLGSWNTLQSAGSLVSWRVSFPGDLVWSKPLQEAWLVPASLQLGSSESDSQGLGLFTLGKEEPNESSQFQELPGDILSC